MIKVIKIKLQLEVEQDGDALYAYCPALPGLHVGGENLEELTQASQDAVSAYVMSLIKRGDPLPVGCNVAEVRFSLWDTLKRLMSRKHRVITTEVSCPA